MDLLRDRKWTHYLIVGGSIAWRSTEHSPPSASDPPPEVGIELMRGRIRLNPQLQDEHYWVWPLPPPGPIDFVCGWPAMGIGATQVALDAGPIRDAATRSVELWPLGRPI